LARALVHGTQQAGALFHELRRPIPPNLNSTEFRKVQTRLAGLRDRFLHSRLHPAARTELCRTIDSVISQAGELSKIHAAIVRKKVTPTELLINYLTGEKALSKAEVPSIVRVAEKMRVAVDWLGVHFYVPREFEPFMEKIVGTMEPWGGFSSTGRLLPSNRNALPVSFTLEARIGGFPNPVEDRITETHEKLHDFARLGGRMQILFDQLTDREIHTLRFGEIERTLQSWFKQELSATLASGDSESVFNRRLQSYFRKVKRLLETKRAFVPAEQKRFFILWNQTQEITYYSFLLAEQPAGFANERRDLVVSGIVSVSPFGRLQRRLFYAWKAFPEIGIHLPPARHATVVPENPLGSPLSRLTAARAKQT
jgi:hypothetical protein